MSIIAKEKLQVETKCDLCHESMGSSLIEKAEYPKWLKQTLDLLTFRVAGENVILCWGCIQSHHLVKEYDRRLNDLTYPKEPGK